MNHAQNAARFYAEGILLSLRHLRQHILQISTIDPGLDAVHALFAETKVDRTAHRHAECIHLLLHAVHFGAMGSAILRCDAQKETLTRCRFSHVFGVTGPALLDGRTGNKIIRVHSGSSFACRSVWRINIH